MLLKGAMVEKERSAGLSWDKLEIDTPELLHIVSDMNSEACCYLSLVTAKVSPFT